MGVLMGKSRVIERGPGIAALKRRMNAAKGYAVKVGALAGRPKDGNDDGLTVAQVAFWNEYGTQRPDGSVHIPERPAFRQGADGARSDLKVLAKAETGAVMDGTRSAEQAMGRLGAFMQGRIQAAIVELRSPPNAESTIKAKKSSNPLIASGQTKNSISFEVIRNTAAAAAAPGRIGGK